MDEPRMYGRSCMRWLDAFPSMRSLTRYEPYVRRYKDGSVKKSGLKEWLGICEDLLEACFGFGWKVPSHELVCAMFLHSNCVPETRIRSWYASLFYGPCEVMSLTPYMVLGPTHQCKSRQTHPH